MNKALFYSCWVVVFLSGVFLRFHMLDQQSLWDDEMTTMKVISMPLSQELHYHRVYEIHPPLFFCQLRVWKRWVGGSLPTLRANSAVWGALSLVAFYGLALSFGMSPGGALSAMALLAFSPFHLAYSQELRPYALAIFLGVTGFWILEKLAKEPDHGWLWAPAFFLLVAELYTHYWGAFVACAQGVYGSRRLEGRRRWRWVGLCAAAIFLFSFWLPVLWDQIHGVGDLTGFWTYAPSPLNLARTFAAFSGVYFRFASSDFLLPGPPVFRTAVGALYALALFWGVRRAPRAASLWLVLGLGLPFALSFWKPGLYLWYRYTSLIYPAFILCVVSGLVSIRPQWLGRLSLCFFLMAELWGCGYYLRGWEKANPKAVVAYVNDHLTSHTVVIRPAYFSDLFSYYYKGSAPVLDQHLQDSEDQRARFGGKDILLIAFDVPSDPVAEAFRAEFKTTAARDFPGFAHLGITVYSLRAPSRI
jgi:uncharacterized membrane protein